MKKDKQNTFDDLIDPLNEMIENKEAKKIIQIPSDGNWFEVSFNSVEVKKDRLVISAKHQKNGIFPTDHDPTEKEYIVTFQGTRAAYIRGFYKQRHPMFGWPYISWDVRSYANHPNNDQIRVYVQNFRAHEEIRKLIVAMERIYGTSNILNKYINDNLLRIQMGIKAKKAPHQIEKEWSKGLMESLGYKHVEVKDTGYPEGNWRDAAAHWCKNKKDLRW